MRTLTLIRHAAVAISPGVCYGRSDVALREPVDDLAAAVRPRLPDGARIVSSPLWRCRALAEALGEEAVMDARFAEIDFGDWELQAWALIDRALLDAWAASPLHFCPPGGESVAAMRHRVIAALDEHGSASDHLVVVAHGGPLRAILGHLLRWSDDVWLRYEISYGACLQLEIAADGVCKLR